MHALGHRSHSVHYDGFKLLKVVVFDLVDEVRTHLNHTMPGGWIGNGAPIAWPPRSPDLTTLDLFVWGYVKNLVYQFGNMTKSVVTVTP
jgi:hypothetical protein